MMAAGQSASVIVTVTGASPSGLGQEIDLNIDLGGDLLKVDPAGEVLLVRAGTTWTGQTASQTVWEHR